MIPAALPVVPISLSLLVKEKKRRKKKEKKKERRNQQLFTFHSKSFILNNIYLLHTCVCMCVPNVASQRFSRGARSFHQKVHLRRRRSWFVVRRRSLYFARKAKSNGHHLPAGRCQLCCEAENPTLPPQKGGKKKEKRKKRKRKPPIPMLCSHLLETNTNEIAFC